MQIVGNMLSKVMEEFEHRLATQNEQVSLTIVHYAYAISSIFPEKEVLSSVSRNFLAQYRLERVQETWMFKVAPRVQR